MKYRVTGPYQVVHDGKQYVAGDVIDASEADASSWVAAGYVEKVKSDEGSKRQADAPNKAQDTASNKAASPRQSRSK